MKRCWYEDIADDVEKWFDTSNDDERRRKRLLCVGKNKKVINVKKQHQKITEYKNVTMK